MKLLYELGIWVQEYFWGHIAGWVVAEPEEDSVPDPQAISFSMTSGLSLRKRGVQGRSMTRLSP